MKLNLQKKYKKILKLLFIGLSGFAALIVFIVGLYITIISVLIITTYIDKKDGNLNFISSYAIKELRKGSDYYTIFRVYQQSPTFLQKIIAPVLWDFDFHDFSITFIGRLKFPWGMDFVPIKNTNHALITNKIDTTLTIMEKDKLIKTIPLHIINRQIITEKNLASTGVKGSFYHPGLHDIIFDPKYNNYDNQYIYLSLILKTQEKNRNCASHAIIKLRYDYKKKEILDNPITQNQIIFETALIENFAFCGGTGSPGNRMFFLKDGTLLYSSGHSARPLGSKILRLTKEGKAVCSIPNKSDNPFCNKKGASKYIYSLGHKNVQGITMDNNGNIYASEHGERKGDEINLIRAGQDYGYPFLCVDCRPYNASSPVPISFTEHKKNPLVLKQIIKKKGYENPENYIKKLVPPLYAWEDYKRDWSIAPSGMAYYSHNNNHYLLVATLRNKEIELLKIQDNKIIRLKPFSFGAKILRFRDVHVYDQKTLYVLTNYNIWRIDLNKNFEEWNN